MRQIDQLNIEPEPINLRRFDQRAADAHAEGLEAALRVPERQSGRQPHYQVEHAPALLAPPWLVHADEVAIERARAEGQVELTRPNRVDQFSGFRDRRR